MVHVFLILLVAGAVAAFAVQNHAPVTVAFLIWEFNFSFAWIVIAAALAGAAMILLADALRSKRQEMVRRNFDCISRRYRW